MPLTLYAAGGSFELADRYDAEEVVAMLENDRDLMLRFDLRSGGEVRLHLQLGCDWSLQID